MIKLIILALLTITAYANQDFTVHQKICPKGEHYMVTVSGKVDKKTGKYVLDSGRPISKCVKVDEKKPKEPTKPKEEKKQVPDTPHIVKILKYGSPHGTGRSFPSKDLCEQEQAKLSKANAGLDYSYMCVKK